MAFAAVGALEGGFELLPLFSTELFPLIELGNDLSLVLLVIPLTKLGLLYAADFRVCIWH